MYPQIYYLNDMSTYSSFLKLRATFFDKNKNKKA